ncbi:CehA/McbA family metallohydrolase [Marinilactibacillus sp. XAAS-LB27]|uniref:CehA/McbA family metallohydrolase n=1 Tax=Marinilactibacillus sp. XAAS-LB27 TaxID=3114538 RepID=UPI002E1730B0|nr:CehA/McbA family metallohydrolase [Marinilactibacillus sp. XAAS-LB27]
MNQYPVELHAHTHHSDGDFSVTELVESALDFGYKGLILTDHNTYSGYEEIVDKLLDQKLVILRGIEWTTYFGHMLVHDSKDFVDWRTATIESIGHHIDQVKEAEGLVGIAHPFAIGNPICTGCHWEFQVQDWSKVDYIEVWNRTAPHKQFWSEKAYDLWTSKLKSGIEISCSAGRDWHRPDAKGLLPGITYVQVPDKLEQSTMKAALKKGSMYITLAPRLEWTLTSQNIDYSFGDRVPEGTYTISVSCLEPSLPLLKELDIEPKRILVIQNEMIIEEIELSKTSASFRFDKTLASGYVRVEIIGRYQNEEDIRLTIGNPVYLK